MQLHHALTPQSLQGDHVENFVDSVVCAHYADELNHPLRKVEGLPAAAMVLGVVHHSHPVALVHAHLDAVGVRPLVPVPEQHVYAVDDAGHSKFHNDALVSSLINGVSRETSFHVVVFAVSV